eukprot:2690285-Pleurochrysis_carterae.AAC.3
MRSPAENEAFGRERSTAKVNAGIGIGKSGGERTGEPTRTGDRCGGDGEYHSREERGGSK